MSEPVSQWGRIEGEAGEFVERLKQLDRGQRAILRRNAGETLATARNATALFYRLLPSGARVHEEIYFLVATLYCLNDKGHGGNFGATMRDIRSRTQSESVDGRMRILLDSEFEWEGGRFQGGGELAYRLRQAVKLAASKEIGVNWAQLVVDLAGWSGARRSAQKRWARSYFQQTREGPSEVSPSEGGQ